MPDNICLDINLITMCPFKLYNHSQLSHLLILFTYLLAHLKSSVNPIRNAKNYFFLICPKSQPGIKFPVTLYHRISQVMSNSTTG